MIWGLAGLTVNRFLMFLLGVFLAIATVDAVAEEGVAAYNRAKNYWVEGNYKLAATEFKNCQAFATDLAEKAAFAYPLAEEKSGNSSAAEEGYIYFIQNFKSSNFLQNAKLRLINLLVKQGYYARAEYFLHTLLPGNLQSEMNQIRETMIINCYLGLGQYSNVYYSMEEYMEKFCNQEFCSSYKLWSAWYHLVQSEDIAEAELEALISSSSNEEVVKEAKMYLVPLLIQNNKIDAAVKNMLGLIRQGVEYSSTELLWLAKYLKDMRELTLASGVLKKIIAKPANTMIEAIALMDLAQVQTESRKFHDALSNFPLVQKALLNSNASIGKIEVLEKLSEYYNALTLRELGQTITAHAILDKLAPAIYDPLYYKILYEQGMVALSMNKLGVAAKTLMRVGILAEDPDLSGKALLRCYDACIAMNNTKLGRICLEELVGRNEGSYGVLYPNSPYTAQAYEILENLE